MADILVLVGSRSDEKIAEKIEETLKEFSASYTVHFVSAHRNPEKVEALIKKNPKVVIAVAGLSAALPGFVASKTIVPVIGVPVSAKLGGMDALLSIVQMPSGIPVASVGIDSGKNAALLALEILALSNEKIRSELLEYRKRMKEQ